MRLPKIPKGLASMIRKAEKKLEAKKRVETRKKEIIAMRKKMETLKKRLQ
jgi:hypothetical protein